MATFWRQYRFNRSSLDLSPVGTGDLTSQPKISVAPVALPAPTGFLEHP